MSFSIDREQPAWRQSLYGGILAVSLVTIFYRGIVDSIAMTLSGGMWTDYYEAYCTATSALVYHNSIYAYAPMDALCEQLIHRNHMPIYAYPPFSVLVFATLIGYDIQVACIAWAILTVLLFVATLYGLRRLVRDDLGRVIPAWYGAAFLAISLEVYGPLQKHLWYGQSNVLMACLGVWALALQMRRSPLGAAAAGGLYAAAILDKLLPGIWAPLLMIYGRWRWLTAAAAAGVVLILATLPVVGLAAWLSFPQAFAKLTYTNGGSPLLANLSLRHQLLDLLASVWGWSSTLGSLGWWVSLIPFAGTYAWFVWAAARERRALAGRPGFVSLMALRLFSVYLLLTLGSASFWPHHLVYPLFAFFLAFYLTATGIQGRRQGLYTLGAAAYLLLGLPSAVTQWLAAATGVAPAVMFPLLEAGGFVLTLVYFELVAGRVRRQLQGAAH